MPQLAALSDEELIVSLVGDLLPAKTPAAAAVAAAAPAAP
jgi:hypothetical protein